MRSFTKRCVICKERQPLGEFNMKRASKDGLQPHCRECNRRASKAYYRRDRARHKEDVRVNNERYAARNRAILLDYLRGHPCVDCGEDDLLVLEFDHVRGTKVRGVFLMAAQGANPAKILAEIEKCEVRCVNCHRRRTGILAGWWKCRPEITGE